jgi:hypothetical protein
MVVDCKSIDFINVGSNPTLFMIKLKSKIFSNPSRLLRKDVRSKKAKDIGSIPMMGFINFQTKNSKKP